MLFSLLFAVYTLLSFRGSTGLYMFQKEEYSDLLPGNGHSGFLLGMSISTTVYQCALQCDSKVNCKSLFFNTDLSQCYTYSKDFGSDLKTDGVDNVNTRYFAVEIRSASGGASSSAAVAVTNTVSTTTIPPPLRNTTTAGIPTTTTTTVNHITTTKLNVATTTIPPPLRNTTTAGIPTTTTTTTNHITTTKLNVATTTIPPPLRNTTTAGIPTTTTTTVNHITTTKLNVATTTNPPPLRNTTTADIPTTTTTTDNHITTTKLNVATTTIPPPLRNTTTAGIPTTTTTTDNHITTTKLNAATTTIPPPLRNTTTAGIPTTTTTTVNHITTTKLNVATTEPQTTISVQYTTIPVTATTGSVCPSVSVPSNDECTNLGYIRSGPYCYMRALTEVKFPTAKSECTSISGMLLVVDSDEEMACIKAFTVSDTFYKIGLEYLDSTWKHTETGEEATYLPWKSLPSPQDDTVIMTNYQYVGWSSTLKNYYICEFDQYFIGNPVTSSEVSVDTTSVSNIETTTIGVQQTTQSACPAVSVPNDGCTDNGYTRVGRYCYEKMLSQVELSEAMSECQTISGTVLVVNSDEEMACVKDITVSGTYFKIGLKRASGSTWISAIGGQAETYLPWKTGEPDASQNCVVMMAYKYLARPCNWRNYFICEFSQYQV